MLRFYFLQNNQTSLVKFIAHIGPTGEDSLRPDPVSTPKGKLWGVWSEWAARNWKKRALDGMFIMFCNSASHWSCELRSRSALRPRGEGWNHGIQTEIQVRCFWAFWITLTKAYPVWHIWRYWTLRAKVPSNVCKGSWEPGSRGSRISTRKELWGIIWLHVGAGENVRRLHVHLSTVSTVSLSEVALGAVDGVAYWTALKRPVLQFFKEKALSTYRDLVWSV